MSGKKPPTFYFLVLIIVFLIVTRDCRTQEGKKKPTNPDC